MTYTDVVVLIPCHSLEDFPSELSETAATGLLNAFACAWHPRLLAGMPQLPRWHRADDPPHPHSGQLVFVPEACEGWLPHDWIERARAAEVVVVEEFQQRSSVLDDALRHLPPADSAESATADLPADFLALGTCWLQVELLTRHMRNFGNIDEVRLQNRVIAAARAYVASDRETAVAHLKASFEILLEAREQFYPLDCFLLDLCLLIPDVANEPFAKTLLADGAVNVLATAADLQAIADRDPAQAEALKTAVATEQLSVVGGELEETAAPVLALGSCLHALEQGQKGYEAVVGKPPRVWARRKFGLFPAWPQLLSQSGYRGALHLALDDGIYPDTEQSRFRWQGCDQTHIEAFSRIPLAVESALTFLKFPARMAEAMDHDHIAAVCFARWPEVKAPWLGDLRRMQRYAPVIGRFITFEQLFEMTGAPGRLSSFAAREYFTPFLLQHVGRREADPLSRYARAITYQRRFDAAQWCHGVARLLVGQPITPAPDHELLAATITSLTTERSGGSEATNVDAQLTAAESAAAAELAAVIVPDASEKARGCLILNPFRFGRRVSVPWPDDATVPAVDGMVKAVHRLSSGGHVVVADVPGFGFTWLPADKSSVAGRPGTTPADTRKSPAEVGVLRSERLEVSLNEATGGVGQVRHLRKRENRVSQLLSFRFPRERVLPGAEDGEVVKSQYAATRCTSIDEPREFGSHVELTSRGEIVDQLNGEVLARFTQQTRLSRHQPLLELDIELTDVKLPDADPWNQYFCVRWAWDNSAATITRCLMDGAHGMGNDRIETTDFLEIADETERLTLIPFGLPFHRKSGMRMLDSLLVVAGERQRRFRFAVALDHAYPLEAAQDAVVPPPIVWTNASRPRFTTGWLFHLDARGVKMLGVRDRRPTTTAEGTAIESTGTGFIARLLETEGRARTAKLRCYRQPVSARKIDLRGQTLQTLAIEGDTVLLDLRPYELANLDIAWSEG